ncbi:MAG: hypothetical protein OEY64_02335 [Nitrospinota bacterium]|nr:hypothetical protein [Nitrospinota bacterium]
MMRFRILIFSFLIAAISSCGLKTDPKPPPEEPDISDKVPDMKYDYDSDREEKTPKNR